MGLLRTINLVSRIEAGRLTCRIYVISKLSDFILHVNVAAGFLPDFVIQAGSRRFLSPNGYMVSYAT
jgi:hypothetical protein